MKKREYLVVAISGSGQLTNWRMSVARGVMSRELEKQAAFACHMKGLELYDLIPAE